MHEAEVASKPHNLAANFRSKHKNIISSIGYFFLLYIQILVI